MSTTTPTTLTTPTAFSEQLKYEELVAICKLLGEKAIPETIEGYLKIKIEEYNR